MLRYRTNVFYVNISFLVIAAIVYICWVMQHQEVVMVGFSTYLLNVLTNNSYYYPVAIVLNWKMVVW